MKREQAFMGIDVGSISTKGVIIDCDNTILYQRHAGPNKQQHSNQAFMLCSSPKRF